MNVAFEPNLKNKEVTLPGSGQDIPDGGSKAGISLVA